MSRRLIEMMTWPVRGQHTAQRNAQQAAIALAHERRHREQVETEVDRLLEGGPGESRRPQ